VGSRTFFDKCELLDGRHGSEEFYISPSDSYLLLPVEKRQNLFNIEQKKKQTKIQ
jgi:hypothetical protein